MSPPGTPFREVLQPVISHEKERFGDLLDRFSPMIEREAVIRDVSNTLINRLSDVILQSIILQMHILKVQGRLKGQTPEDRYNDFVSSEAGDWQKFERFLAHSKTRQLVKTTTNQFFSFCHELLGNFVLDKPVISSSFDAEAKKVAHISLDLGDIHRLGRSVSCIEFETGVKVIYKPRSLAIDLHYKQLLLWVASQGLECSPYRIRIANRDKHGWVEYISYKECSRRGQVESFYRRAGNQLALVYLLDGADFYSDNLIAHGEFPVVIDLEMLFSGNTSRLMRNHLCGLGANRIKARSLVRSVLISGFLPQWMLLPPLNRSALDRSALVGDEGESFTIETVFERKDLVRESLEVIRFKDKPEKNRPRRDLNALDHVEEVVDGFQELLSVVMKNKYAFKQRLKIFENDEVRHIIRPTRGYANLLHLSYYPDILKSGGRASIIKRMLKMSDPQGEVKRFRRHEYADLLSQNVPIFITTPLGRDCYDSHGARISKVFPEPSMTLVLKKLRNLNAGICREQVSFIHYSLEGYKAIRAAHAL